MIYYSNQHSVIGQLYFKNIENHRKRDQICSPRGRDGSGDGELDEGSEMYKLPIIWEISTRDVMYNMMSIINTAVCYI